MWISILLFAVVSVVNGGNIQSYGQQHGGGFSSGATGAVLLVAGGTSHGGGSGYGFGQGIGGGFGQGGGGFIQGGSGVSHGGGSSSYGGGRPGGNNNGHGSSGSCRYWCKRPQGGQYYCCETQAQINNNNGGSGLHPGSCPPVRNHCPPTRNFGGPPRTCSSDSSCGWTEKCCYDTCLSSHVCKPPQTRW